MSRFAQRGTVLLGCAGGMLVLAAGLAGGYYVLSTRSEARAANAAPVAPEPAPMHGAVSPDAVKQLLARQIDVKTGSATVKLAWSELGVEVDPDELQRPGGGDPAALGSKVAIPVRFDRA